MIRIYLIIDYKLSLKFVGIHWMNWLVFLFSYHETECFYYETKQIIVYFYWLTCPFKLIKVDIILFTNIERIIHISLEDNTRISQYDYYKKYSYIASVNCLETKTFRNRWIKDFPGTFYEKKDTVMVVTHFLSAHILTYRTMRTSTYRKQRLSVLSYVTFHPPKYHRKFPFPPIT